MKTAAQIRATTKYDSQNYDKITLMIRKDREPTRETIKAAADAAGLSANSFIIEAIREKISSPKK